MVQMQDKSIKEVSATSTRTLSMMTPTDQADPSQILRSEVYRLPVMMVLLAGPTIILGRYQAHAPSSQPQKKVDSVSGPENHASRHSRYGSTFAWVSNNCPADSDWAVCSKTGDQEQGQLYTVFGILSKNYPGAVFVP